ncbi:DUF808 family protein, partial [Pseudomonas sp.]|uniref:DUF808 family protein n=1 Tax=Pseudomonas sp. TaxID=306 RepID=UPI003F9C5A3D
GDQDGARKLKRLSEAEAKVYEAKKVIGAIVTDFVLSAEIVVITLNVVAEAPFVQQLITLVLISLLVTFGVYGLVAGIVRIDDLGLRLRKITNPGHFAETLRRIGGWLISAAPKLMKLLSWVGTIAMFFVGGAFIAEAIHGGPEWIVTPAIKHWLENYLMQAVVGLIAGGVAVAAAWTAKQLTQRVSG